MPRCSNWNNGAWGKWFCDDKKAELDEEDNNELEFYNKLDKKKIILMSKLSNCKLFSNCSTYHLLINFLTESFLEFINSFANLF